MKIPYTAYTCYTDSDTIFKPVTHSYITHTRTHTHEIFFSFKYLPISYITRVTPKNSIIRIIIQKVSEREENKKNVFSLLPIIIIFSNDIKAPQK